MTTPKLKKLDFIQDKLNETLKDSIVRVQFSEEDHDKDLWKVVW